MRSARPAMQFATLEQQAETAELGMWVFLATEILFFGALLLSYFVYRQSYPAEFLAAAKDSRIDLGGINAALLITSSLTMVLAIRKAAIGDERRIAPFLLATAALGFAFLGVKGYEYVEDYASQVVPALDFVLKPGERRPGELYWVFYFIATFIHAIHMSIGIGVVLVMAGRARRGDFGPRYYAPLEVTGLYWSFVDTVWIVLFAAIYPWGKGG